MNTESIDGFFNFCPVLAEMLRTNSLVGRSGKRFDALGALSSVNNLATLRRLAIALKPQRTLEIGLSFGGSCLVFSTSHRDLGASPDHQHVALDPFQKSDWDETGLLVVEKAGLAGYLDFRPQFSSLELPALIREERKFDLVYIDGSHLFEDVFIDFYYVARLLNDGGVVAFDDCADPHVAKVLAFVRKNMTAAFEEMDLGPHRLDEGRPLHYRLAKALGKTQMRAFRKIGKAQREWNAPFASF